MAADCSEENLDAPGVKTLCVLSPMLSVKCAFLEITLWTSFYYDPEFSFFYCCFASYEGLGVTLMPSGDEW